jgi:predicted aldo/keto reductase-like oxidoreductase
MFENKFVSLPSHLKTIEPMEVHRESRTMCNTETSKVISRTDPVMEPLDGGRGIWIPKKDEKLSTKQRKSAKSLHFAFYFCIFAFRKLEG